uniref:DUF7064 domain-containing protein n=1 Tax=Acrobeloides nanus TaxID=290746 RepID=A0A914CCT7_9BILA
MAQRQDDVINLFCLLKVPGVGTFVNEDLPSTSNVKSLSTKTEYITECGFKVFCEEPMKKWRILFDGNLVPSDECHPNLTKIGPDTNKEPMALIKATLDLTWINQGEYFDFDLECSPEAIGSSIAREPWSRALFERLKNTHQLHYEQFGTIMGRVQVGDFVSNEVKMISMRDHTITKYRNWSEIRRYIMLIYHLEDGTCIHTSVISMPEVVFSHLQFGYIVTKELEKIPVDNINLNLWEIGENKNVPNHFSYSFRAGGKLYNVEVNVKDSIKFKMGLDQACYVEENMCEFVANGIKGYGFAEFEYRIDPY